MITDGFMQARVAVAIPGCNQKDLRAFFERVLPEKNFEAGSRVQGCVQVLQSFNDIVDGFQGNFMVI